jgi:hypothetical protein
MNVEMELRPRNPPDYRPQKARKAYRSAGFLSGRGQSNKSLQTA